MLGSAKAWKAVRRSGGLLLPFLLLASWGAAVRVPASPPPHWLPAQEARFTSLKQGRSTPPAIAEFCWL